MPKNSAVIRQLPAWPTVKFLDIGTVFEQTGKTQIRLLLKEQSDKGLPYLSVKEKERNSAGQDSILFVFPKTVRN